MIRIGHLSTFYHTAMLLQARGDAAQRLGIELEWRMMGTGPEIMRAFGRGELDLAYVGLPPAIIGISQGIPVICVAGGHMEGTVAAGKQSCRAYPEVRTLGEFLRQFSGRTIGVPGTGSIHDVILKSALRDNSLTDAVMVKNYPWADLVTEAIVRDEVAAAFGTPALASAIKRFAGGKVLFPPALLWPHNPSYGIVARTGFLESSPGLVEQFLTLHEEAEAVLRNEPGKAAEAIAAYVGIIDAEFVLDALRISPKYCAQLSVEFMQSTMRFVRVMKELGFLQKEPVQAEIFRTDIIERVHPEADHYGMRSG